MAVSATSLTSINVHSGDELRELCDRRRQFYFEESERLSTFAVAFQSALKKIRTGHGVLSSTESAIVARQLSRHVRRVADLQFESAKGMVVLAREYERKVVNPSKAPASAWKV